MHFLYLLIWNRLYVVIWKWQQSGVIRCVYYCYSIWAILYAGWMNFLLCFAAVVVVVIFPHHLSNCLDSKTKQTSVCVSLNMALTKIESKIFNETVNYCENHSITHCLGILKVLRGHQLFYGSFFSAFFSLRLLVFEY